MVSEAMNYVDAPGLVEQPLVLGVVHPGHDPGDGELLLGQQADHQVVLVVAGDRGHHVGLAHADAVEAVDLAGVGLVPGDVGRLAGDPGLLDPLGLDLDDVDLVAGLLQLAADERADGPTAGDDDLHLACTSAP
jgi:hypothetical protein